MRVAFALIGLIAVAAPAADEPPALADLLVHVGRYVRGFQVDFATVIGDETYRQLVHTWQIAFSERRAPTMISVDGRNARSTGMIWVTSSGIVLRTRLALTDPTSRLHLGMVVSYGRDAKLGGWVPVRMEETYSQTRNQGAVDEDIACSATYPNHRRFETSARIVPPR